MKKLKRSLIFILAMIMVIGTQSFTVFADGEENVVEESSVNVENKENEERTGKVESTLIDEGEAVSEDETIGTEIVDGENEGSVDGDTEIYAMSEEVEPYAEGDMPKSGTCGDNLTWTLSDDGILTISGNGPMRDYTSDENGIAVDFPNPFVVRKVVIEDGVTSIGDYAFEWYHTTESFEIPNSVTKIGERAFARCDSLQEIEIPDSVNEMGSGLFSICESLTRVKLSNNIKDIKDNMFYMCMSLEEIEIPEGVTEIGNWTFYECQELKKIKLPNSLRMIGDGAFDCCTALTEVKIPTHVTSMGQGAFHGCGLMEIVVPGSVGCIDVEAFSYCYNLKRVILENGVMQIESGAFSHCEVLEQIEIPQSVTSIGVSAFDTCSSLKEIVIPGSVLKIGEGAFWGCSSLKSVRFDGDAPEFEGEEPNTFLMVTANAYHPENNPTWTADKMQNYGGTLTWSAWNLYIVEEATDSVYVKGSSNGATIKCTEELGKFISVAVDGVIVDSSNYTVAEGSTVLTFLSSYLDTLSVGDHVVTLNYTYGSVDTRLTVLENGTNLNTPANGTNASGNAENVNGGFNPKQNGSVQGGVPKTGDNTSIVLWTQLMIIASCGYFVLMRMMRVRKRGAKR